jgi:hypothetical protein
MRRAVWLISPTTPSVTRNSPIFGLTYPQAFGYQPSLGDQYSHGKLSSHQALDKPDLLSTSRTRSWTASLSLLQDGWSCRVQPVPICST